MSAAAASGDAAAHLRVTLDPQAFPGRCARGLSRSPRTIPRCSRSCIATADATRHRPPEPARLLSRRPRQPLRDLHRRGARGRADGTAGHAGRTNPRRAARALRARGVSLVGSDLRVHRTLHLPGIVRGPDAVRAWAADSRRRGAAGGRFPGASRGHPLSDHAGGLAGRSGRGRQLAVLHGPALRHGTGPLLLGSDGRARKHRSIGSKVSCSATAIARSSTHASSPACARWSICRPDRSACARCVFLLYDLLGALISVPIVVTLGYVFGKQLEMVVQYIGGFEKLDAGGGAPERRRYRDADAGVTARRESRSLQSPWSPTARAPSCRAIREFIARPCQRADVENGIQTFRRLISKPS